MDPAHRRKATVGSILIGIGILCALLTYCRVGAGFAGSLITVGYSTGKELFEGNCKHKPTLAECVDCCLTAGVGLPSSEQVDCVNRCIAHHNSAPPGGGNLAAPDDPLAGTAQALRKLMACHKTITNFDTKDYVGFNNAKRFIRICASVDDKSVRDLAKILCRDLDLVDTAQI